MIRLAPHYIEEPPYEEPPFGWCPECNGPLVDAHECRCGWNEYEAIDGAASQCAAEADTKAPGKLQSGAPAGVKASANGRNRSGQPLFVRSHVARCRGDSMTIYVVEGSTGEYSDHREWMVRAYADKSKAEAKVLRCEERAREALPARDRDDYWDNPEKALAPFKDEDPDMQIDYTGIRYYLCEVEFEP